MRSRLRFGIALALAAVLGGWLFYASIGGSTETYAAPSQLTGEAGTYRLNGIVAPPAPADAAERAQSADGLTFWVHDKTDAGSRVKVVYRGNVPDAFRGGREVVVTGELQNGTFVAKRNSLVTLCPSKFSDKPASAQSTAEQ
jgi:cytochrome c-type biogenesis protein CcmE